MRRSAMALLLASAAAAPALANDTSAELATGGLVFVHNEAVEMRAEDLTISAKEVNVRYRFFNTSDKPVTVLVAFPMPDIKIDEMDQNISVPTEDPVNLLAFATTVNGQAVKTEVEQRVIAVGIDRTQLLRSLGIPLAPHLQATNDALDKLAKDKWDELVRLGLAEIEEYDAGKGLEKHLAARWALSTTFYWQQTFAPKMETAVEHKYKPSVGLSVQTSLGSPDAASEPWYEDYKRKYCIDNEFLAALDRARRAARVQFGAPYSEQRIDYVLKTGANWSGPIQNFRLVVDKGDADSMVSFCAEGMRRLNPNQFEVKKTDFTPEGDLSVLILKKLPPGQP
jgi:hypothetical protein